MKLPIGNKPTVKWHYALPVIIVLSIVGATLIYTSLAGTKNFRAASCTASTKYQGTNSLSVCKAQSAEGWVSRAYWAIFNRPVDSPALYSQLVQKFMSRETSAPELLIKDLLTTNEANQNFNKLSPSQKTTWLYKNVLMRKPDKASGTYWSGELAKTSRTAATIKRFVQTNEAIKQTQARVDEGIKIALLTLPDSIATTDTVTNRSIIDGSAPYILTGVGSYQYDVAPGFAEKLGNHILVGSFPTTGSQAVSTMNTMRLNAINLSTGKSEWLALPTNRSKVEVAAPRGYGGADVSDICTTVIDDKKVAYGISAVPYKNWDLKESGQFPFLPKFFVDDKGLVSYNQSETLATFEQLRANALSSTLANQFLATEDTQLVQPRASSGFAECASLPDGSISVTQYFPGNGKTSGSVIVLSKEGFLLAGVQLPAVNGSDGKPARILPRDIQAAPQLVNGKAYIGVVADAFGSDGKPIPFPIYELTYEPTTRKLEIIHAPMVSGEGRRFTRSAYLPNGDLVADTLNLSAPGPYAAFRSSGTVYYKRQKLDAVPKQPTSIQTVAPDKIMSPTAANDEPVSVDIGYSKKHNIILQASTLGHVSAYNATTLSICGRLDPNLPALIPTYDSAGKLAAVLKGPYDETNDFWWLPLRISGTGLSKAPLLYGVNVSLLASKCQ